MEFVGQRAAAGCGAWPNHAERVTLVMSNIFALAIYEKHDFRGRTTNLSTAPATDEALDHAQSFVACIRDVVREELANAGSSPSADINLDELKSELREELRRDIVATGSEGSGADPVQACLENAETLFASEEWKKQVNQMIQEALKGVLPTMVKRFRTEMEDAMGDLPSGSGGDGDSSSVINSTQMKEMLEDRFRQMLLYLKTDVIPKAVKQSMPG